MPILGHPIIQQLELSPRVVDTAGGNLCITRMGVELMALSHNEAFERRSPMHDVQSAHRCEGEGAREKVTQEIP